MCQDINSWDFKTLKLTTKALFWLKKASVLGWINVPPLPLRIKCFTTHRCSESWGNRANKIFPADRGPSPSLPFDCLLGQHPIASQKCHTTQDGQVLQGLEHVELSPVDIHEPQHSYKNRHHDSQLNETVKTNWGRGQWGAVIARSTKGLFLEQLVLFLLSDTRKIDNSIYLPLSLHYQEIQK